MNQSIYNLMLDISKHIMNTDLKGYKKFGVTELSNDKKKPLLA
jgi:hypothetical protein